MGVEDSFLKSITYFSGLSLAELDSVKKLVFEKKVERGDIIVFEGDPPEALYFVGAGVVKIFRTSADGKEQVLNIVRPGGSFNDVPAFDGGPNLASAQAMGPVTLYGIPKQSLDAFLRDYHQTAVSVAKVLATQVRHLVLLVEDLSFRPVVGRVAKVLLEYAGDGAGPGQRLTQQDMADMVGTAREVVSRSLKALQSEGVIKIDRHRIVVTDKETLRSIAGVST
jgi:CRP/FNR family cyclic AMP-dependent transcriptional regulator